MDDPGAAPVPCDVLDIAVQAARRGGQALLARFGRPSGVVAKTGPADLVSDADRHAEEAIADRHAEEAIAEVLGCRRPSDAVLGEEGSADRPGSTGLRWLVDPLDGTPHYSPACRSGA